MDGLPGSQHTFFILDRLLSKDCNAAWLRRFEFLWCRDLVGWKIIGQDIIRNLYWFIFWIITPSNPASSIMRNNPLSAGWHWIHSLHKAQQFPSAFGQFAIPAQYQRSKNVPPGSMHEKISAKYSVLLGTRLSNWSCWPPTSAKFEATGILSISPGEFDIVKPEFFCVYTCPIDHSRWNRFQAHDPFPGGVSWPQNTVTRPTAQVDDGITPLICKFCGQSATKTKVASGYTPSSLE